MECNLFKFYFVLQSANFTYHKSGNTYWLEWTPNKALSAKKWHIVVKSLIDNKVSIVHQEQSNYMPSINSCVNILNTSVT